MEPDQISSVEADWSGSTLFVRSLFLVHFNDISADNMGSRLFAGTVLMKFFKGEVINTYKIGPHAIYNVAMASLGVSGQILGGRQTSRLFEYMFFTFSHYKWTR